MPFYEMSAIDAVTRERKRFYAESSGSGEQVVAGLSSAWCGCTDMRVEKELTAKPAGGTSVPSHWYNPEALRIAKDQQLKDRHGQHITTRKPGIGNIADRIRNRLPIIQPARNAGNGRRDTVRR